MATAYVFNGFGKYQTKDNTRDGEQGIAVTYGGVSFWFPYGKTTPIPNYTFRVVDHEKTTPERGEILLAPVYRETNVMGDVIARAITENQQPVPNKEKGIVLVEGEPTGQAIKVFGGVMEYGQQIEVEVMQREARKGEVKAAYEKAEAYKKQNIQEYFQSKRQRMAGGQGKLVPDTMTRLFMEELNIEDLDDVTAHAKNHGMNKETLAELLQQAFQAGGASVANNLGRAVKSVRSEEGGDWRRRTRSQGLAEHAAAYDAEQAAKEQKEDTEEVTGG